MSGSHIYGNIALVKTTVDLEAGLFKTARKRAIDEGRSFRAVLNDALRLYLQPPGAAARKASGQPRRRRAVGPAAAGEPAGEAASPEAEFWAVVNDRSRWDEMFGDRLQKIEDDIARATADWEQRNRG